MFFRREVENVLANQSPGWSSWFFDLIKYTNLAGDIEYMLPIKFHQIQFNGFRKKCPLLTRQFQKISKLNVRVISLPLQTFKAVA